MRDLKFRAWDTVTEKFFWPWPEGFNLFGEVTCFDAMGQQLAEQGRSSILGLNDLEIEQFTGLKDSAEKEIYEGDIVEFTYWWFDGHGEAETTLKGEVIYLPESLSFGLKGVKNKDWCEHVGCDPEVGDTCAFAFWRFEEDDFHVIGDIHQHPELLK